MTKIPVITRLNTQLESHRYHEARRRGAKILLGYTALVLGAVAWVLWR